MSNVIFQMFGINRNLFLLFSYLLLTLLFVRSPHSQPEQYDIQNDGILDYKDIFFLHDYWQHPKSKTFSPHDLVKFIDHWHNEVSPVKLYSEGRATGIYAVIETEDKSYTTNEFEIDITNSTPNGFNSLPALISPKEASQRLFTDPYLTSIKNKKTEFPTAQEAFAVFSEAALNLGVTNKNYISPKGALFGIEFGKARDQIGTFNGNTIWIGFSGSFSESYVPKSETYSWIVYFAPEGAYLALQWGKANYSKVDLFISYNTFFGTLRSPDYDVLKRSYINSLMGLSISFTIPFISIDSGLTFASIGNSNEFEKSIQIDFSKGVDFPFVVGLPDFPISVSREYDSGVEAGFYPYIAWDLSHVSGNPIPAIVNQLEELATQSGETYESNMTSQSAHLLLAFLKTIDPTRSNSKYTQNINEFITSDSNNTTIDQIIDKVEDYVEEGDVHNPPEELTHDIIRSLPNPLSMTNQTSSIKSGVQAAYETGVKYAYDLAVQEGRRDDNKLYSKGIKVIYSLAGEPCIIEVTAGEIVELIPGTNESDFEGSIIEFDPQSATSQAIQKTLENGKAIYEFTPETNQTILLCVRVLPNQATNYKTIELARRKIIVQPTEPEKATIFGNTSAPPNTPVELSTTLVDSIGIPVNRPSKVKLFDYRGYLIHEYDQDNFDVSNISINPEPSLPIITQLFTSKIGYSEEESWTGYILNGYGFSKDADVLINSVSVNDMQDWLWQIDSSREILFLPPDDDHLLTGRNLIQVVNPESIMSDEFVYVSD